ncbi:cadherin repeat domain-containing protein, partial [Marinobacterium sp. xm-a-152]|uniref:cadherin repeat domain-containing protein n=1 Tax=Marinobacterium sp. xm-a-152 TaxID=2497733 RepID=UPI00156891FE
MSSGSNKTPNKSSYSEQTVLEATVKLSLDEQDLDGINELQSIVELDQSDLLETAGEASEESYSNGPKETSNHRQAKFVLDEESEEILSELEMLDGSEVPLEYVASTDSAAPSETVDNHNEGVSESEAVEEVQDVSSSAESASLSSMSSLGLIGLGAVALGVAGGSSAAASAIGFSVSGSILLGTVTDASGLELKAYKSDGTELAGTGTVNNDGTYTFEATENYTGPMLLSLVDTGNSAQYVDEATGATTTGLTTDLRVVVNSTGGSVTAAITPLTELAARELLDDTGGDAGTASVNLASVTADQVNTVNSAVASAFGLDDIVSVVPVTIDDPDYDAAGDGANTAEEAYGQILAAISGLEASSGGDTGDVLNQLAAALDTSSATGELDQTAIEALEEELVAISNNVHLASGSTGFAAKADSTVVDKLAGAVFNLALSTDQSGAAGDDGDFVVQIGAATLTAELDAALTLGVQSLWLSKDGGTTWVDVTSDLSGVNLSTSVALTGAGKLKLAIADDVTLAGEDFDGALGLVGKVTTQSYVVDADVPVFTSGQSLDFAENGTAAVVQVQSTDATSVTYSLSGDDSAKFTIDKNSGAIKFVSAPDFETEADQDAGNDYELTITATDRAGNSSNLSITVNVTNVNEAPDLNSGAAVSVAENEQSVGYIAAATDVDAADTLVYSLTGADADLFSIDEVSGVITFVSTNGADFEAVGSADGDNVYDLNVVVTDEGGLTDTQALAVTVTDVNEAPEITSATSVEVAENTQAVGYTATSSDVDANDTRTYSL